MENYNVDLSKRVTVDTAKHIFLNSSSGKANKIPLEFEDEESGRETAIIEYKAGKTYKSHSYPLGEEIFVLEGVFSDEYGDYPAGTYIRNPSGTSHTPHSIDGCKLFVKANQMHAEDTERVIIDTNEMSWHPGYGALQVMPLSDKAALVKWPKGAKFLDHSHYGGEEIFVLKGEFIDEHGIYPKGTWIRSPHLSKHFPYVKEETIIFVKTGHLLSLENSNT